MTNQPKIFQWLQDKGNIEQEEMFRTFNCGVGMIIICKPEKKELLIKKLKKKNEPFFILGKVAKKNGKIDIF